MKYTCSARQDVLESVCWQTPCSVKGPPSPYELSMFLHACSNLPPNTPADTTTLSSRPTPPWVTKHRLPPHQGSVCMHAGVLQMPTSTKDPR